MKKSNRGFSFVELLAAIVIMGLLSGLAIVSIRFLTNKAEKEYYKAQESEVVMSAKSYTQDNRNYLPKRVGMKRQIYLSTLQDKKYIGDVVDRSKKKCDPTKSYVQVYRYDKNHYNYVVNLVCDRYKSSEDDDALINEKPTVSINFLNVSKTDKYSDAKARIVIKDDHKISSYSYIIMKDNEEVKNSGDIDGKLQTKIDTNISLTDYVPGKITVKVVATNTLGNQGNGKANTTVQNENAPTCEVIRDNSVKDVNGKPTCEGKWINNPDFATVEAQVKCIDKSGSGCQKDVYTQKFFGERKTDFISMADNTGNTAPCEVYVCIDVTKPTTPVIDNPYEGIWINKSYSIKISSYDKTAGIAYFEYRYPDSTGVDGNGVSEKEWHQWANSSKNPGDTTPFVTTPFSKERDEYVEVRACDRAGNCSDIARSKIRIDKTDPTCTITRNKANPDGLNDWYVTNVNLKLNPKNNHGSGDRAVDSPISYELKNTNSASYKGTTTGTQTETKGITWYGFVKDEAGNKSTCNSGSFKVDTTAPTCTVNRSGTAGRNNWYRSNVSLSLSTNDNMSGVDTYDLKSTNSASYNKNTTATITYETNKINWYGFVKDKAGNTNSCSTTFGIDKTSPTVRSEGHSESTTWCTGKRVSASCSDDRSGVYDYGTSRSTVSSTVRYTCEDNAGNTDSMTKHFTVVDKKCVTYNSCRHSSFGCAEYSRTLKTCLESSSTQSQKASGKNTCSELNGKGSKTCEARSGCIYRQQTCAGEHWVYSCPNNTWTLSGKTCYKTVYSYSWSTTTTKNSSCTVRSSFTCNSSNADKAYTSSCSCNYYNSKAAYPCSCNTYNCSD